MGSSLAKTGYGCDQVALVSLWRRVWAAASATDPTAPFGICTLVKHGRFPNDTGCVFALMLLLCCRRQAGRRAPATIWPTCDGPKPATWARSPTS